MKRLRTAYHNFSLRAKLAVLSSAVLLAVLCVCQGLLYTYVAEYASRQSRAQANVTLTQAQTYMEAKLRNIVERLFYIRLDSAFDGVLTEYLLSGRPSARGVAMTLLSAPLSLHKATEPLISSMYLYTPEGSFTDMGISAEQGYRFETSAPGRAALQSEEIVLWGEAQRDEIFITHRAVVPVAYRFSVPGYEGDCVLLANIDQQRLTQYLQDILPDDGSDILLVDAAGRPVMQTWRRAALALAQSETALRAALDADFTEWDYGGEQYLTAHCALTNAPWQLVYLQSKTQLARQLRSFQLVFLAASLCAVLVLLLALTRIVHSITQPLSLLARHMSGLETRGGMQGFDYPYRNEVGDLARSFNSMLERIHGLIKEQELYISQLQEGKKRLLLEQQLKRHAELQALQAQINPHFLYNTLDSIRWKAERAGAEDISRMTTALATLFRIGLSRGRELISLEQETLHVESYLQIQKLRYGDRLSYTIEIEPQLLELYTVKLILQPLVENAIYHGVKEGERPGVIRITGRRTEHSVELCVADNGSGIAPGRLKMLQADLARGLSVNREGYGIFNVNERIRLYFGVQYGVTLESVYGQGTRAILRLPCITQSEVEQYVSPVDRG